jgi:hypothetical protein
VAKTAADFAHSFLLFSFLLVAVGFRLRRSEDEREVVVENVFDDADAHHDVTLCKRHVWRRLFDIRLSVIRLSVIRVSVISRFVITLSVIRLSVIGHLLGTGKTQNVGNCWLILN